MSGPEVKKRHVQGVNTSTMETPATRRTPKASTVTWDEIPEWQRDNKHILSGYRTERADYLEILTSLTFLHNETCNVYTHLVGALLLPLIATTYMRVLSEPQFLDVSGTDYVMFGIFFWCAEGCLIFSATYHLVGPHSPAVEEFWHQMDLLGIVIVSVGTSYRASIISSPVNRACKNCTGPLSVNPGNCCHPPLPLPCLGREVC